MKTSPFNGARQAAAEERERERVSVEFGLPVCDVYRDGDALLADAVEMLREELF
ncbi:hypothetical protein [Stieleria marina]|uniref:hypothetical protein n=1 Tax=Stieleria marina TaxID=1930275 RepID=UPI003AF33908